MNYGLFFFFQAEDGIRDGTVTGVQTCALPICLGLIRRLIWVAPPHVMTRYSDKAPDQLRQMDGVGPDDIMSFRRVDGRIEGRLLGLDLTVCDLGQVEAVPLPGDSVIDIDVDYFVTVPGDRAWIDPAEAFVVLRRLPVSSDRVTLSRSVSSRFTPFRHPSPA